MATDTDKAATLDEYSVKESSEETGRAAHQQREQVRIDSVELGRPFPHLEGVTHRFVEVAGVRLHIAEAGSGEPVILLHTMPQHWFAWHHIIPQLASDYHVIAVDFRGFGWSDAPPNGYDTMSRVADTLALMDALGLKRARVIGHGWGAWVGFFLCLRAPERVSHYLALNMVHPWPERRTTLTQAWRFWHTAFWEYPRVGRLVLRHWPGFTRFLLCHWVSDATIWDEPVLAEFVESSREPAHARAGEAVNWQYVLHDIPNLQRGANKAQRLTVPTLLLGGSEDVVISPKMLSGGERYADDLTVRIIAGSGHLLPEECPSAVVAAARELFTRRTAVVA